mgnify:CR=1 FL=1
MSLPPKPTVSAIRDARVRSGGFGLVELITAIAVLGVLASILFPFYNNVQDGAQERKCKRIAQEFAAISTSASAAGSYDLADAGSVAEAMELLVNGVSGSGLFGETQFRVSQVRHTDQSMAAHYLTLRDGVLIYDPLQEVNQS